MAEEMTGGCACGKVRYTVQVHDDGLHGHRCKCRIRRSRSI